MKATPSKEVYFFSSSNLSQQLTNSPEIIRKGQNKPKDNDSQALSISNLGFSLASSNNDGKFLIKSAREKQNPQIDTSDNLSNNPTYSSRQDEKNLNRFSSTPQKVRPAHNSATQHSRPALKEILKYKATDSTVRPVYQIQREEVFIEDKLPSLKVPKLGFTNRQNSRLMDISSVAKGGTGSDRNSMNVFDRASSWNQIEKNVPRFISGDKIQEIVDEAARLNEKKASNIKKISFSNNLSNNSNVINISQSAPIQDRQLPKGDSPIFSIPPIMSNSMVKPAKSNLLENNKKINEVRVVNNYVEKKSDTLPEVKAFNNFMEKKHDVSFEQSVPKHKRSNSQTLKEKERDLVKELVKEIAKEKELMKEKEIRQIFETDRKLKPVLVKSILKNNVIISPKPEVVHTNTLNKSANNILRRTGMLPKRVRFQM